MTQKSYRKHSLPQYTRHVSHTRNSYSLRRNKFANVEYFYCMTKGHTSNMCFYRRLHLNLLSLDYLETNQPSQERSGFKRMCKLYFICVLEVHKNKN